MDSSASNGNLKDDEHTQNQLDSIFQHPEGLQTARNLVQAVYSNWVSQTSQPQNPNVPATSPEVEGILKDILSFSSLHEREFAVGQSTNGGRRDAITMEHDAMIVPPTQRKSSQDGTPVYQPVPRSHAPASPTHPTLQRRPLQQTAVQRLLTADNAAENEIRSIFGGRTIPAPSLLQGTESPYRVESPADPQSEISTAATHLHRRKGPTSAPSMHTGGNSMSRFHVTTTNRKENQGESSSENKGNAARSHPLEQEYSSHDVRTSIEPHNKHNQTTSNPHTTSSTSTYSVSYAGLPAVSTNLTRKASPTIKSFLPVNKYFAQNSSEYNDNAAVSASSKSSTPNLSQGMQHQTQSSARDPYFSSLQSPSPPPSFLTPQRGQSPTLDELSSPCLTENESDSELSSISVQRKRKANSDGLSIGGKKHKGESGSMQLVKKAARKAAKSKQLKSDQAKEKLPQAIWMRILEFTPPHFLTKARLINKTFKAMVDHFDSIFINCRKENFGWDMPPPPKGLTERQYSDLFGGKGCLEPGCPDTASSRTHWSWAKRWCQDCWKNKIEREDRAIKKYQNRYVRPTLIKLLECIPVGVHDSFMKPHDYIDNIESRERQAPRLYKYYLIEDVHKVIAEFEALAPAPFVENPNDTDEQKAWARSEHQKLVDALEEKQNEFFADRKKINDEHMSRVQRIETAVREKRSENRKPNTANRDARKALFVRRANEDLPEIPSTFVRSTKAFKAATRIFRDAGTERGWQTLKPKIQKEWEEKKENSPSPALLDQGVDSDDGGDMLQPPPHPALGQHIASRMVQHTTASYPGPDLYGLGPSHLPDLSSASLAYRNLTQMPQVPSFGGMYSGNANNRSLSHSAYLAAAYALPQPTYHNNNMNANFNQNAQQHQHYQQMMGGNQHYHNNRAMQRHGQQQHPSRPMSIPSLLQDNSNMMRFGHPHHTRPYMG